MVFLLRIVLYFDVLSVSMRFSIQFCIYEYIQSYCFKRFSKNSFSEMTEMEHVFFWFKLLLRPWDLSHHLERQKLMVNSWEEISVRFRKGGFAANLF